jgi:hypothetical protein
LIADGDDPIGLREGGHSEAIEIAPSSLRTHFVDERPGKHRRALPVALRILAGPLLADEADERVP